MTLLYAIQLAIKHGYSTTFSTYKDANGEDTNWFSIVLEHKYKAVKLNISASNGTSEAIIAREIIVLVMDAK
jgi:hypothetical protein